MSTFLGFSHLNFPTFVWRFLITLICYFFKISKKENTFQHSMHIFNKKKSKIFEKLFLKFLKIFWTNFEILK